LTADPRSGTPLSDDAKKAKRKLADDLLKRAKGGEDFSKLAREYSEDSQAKVNGGETTFARTGAPLEFAAAAFSLKTNQISDVVTTAIGYHIIKLTEKIPPRKEELTPKLSGDIKDYLQRQAIEKKARDYYNTLRKEAKVEILDPQLKKLVEADDTSAFPAPATAPK
jgi:parvulin-like peptidyl-prolyl isomerase